MVISRIYGFDYLRCAAAFSVVWIHACFTSRELTWLNLYNSYAVPVFILMSIFLSMSRVQKEKLFSIKRVFQRIYPQYFFWTFIYLVLRFAKHKFIGGDSFTIDFSVVFLGGSAVQLWFLPAILIWQSIQIFLFSYKNIWIDLALTLLIFLIARNIMDSGILGSSFFFYLLRYSGYIFIAKIIFQYQFYFQRLNPKILLFCFIILIILKSLSNFWLVDVIYSTIVFLLFLVIPFKESKVVSSLSNSSFGIYLAHFLFIQIVLFIFGRLGIGLNIWLTFFNILSSYLLSYGLVHIFSLNKYTKRFI